MSVELIKKISLKKGKEIVIYCACSNVTPKTYSKNIFAYDDYILYLINNLIQGNFHLNASNDNIAKVFLSIKKVKFFLDKETKEKKLLKKSKYTNELESYIDYFARQCYKFKNDEKCNKNILDKVIEIFEKEYFNFVDNKEKYFPVQISEKYLEKRLSIGCEFFYNWKNRCSLKIKSIPLYVFEKSNEFNLEEFLNKFKIKGMSCAKALFVAEHYPNYKPLKQEEIIEFCKK